MSPGTQVLPVERGAYRLYAELTAGPGEPLVLMHGFPDNTHLYDRLMPHLVDRRAIVRFDFLGWGRSDKPENYPYTATNQIGDLDAVVGATLREGGYEKVVLVAHDASGPPAIDWALDHPDQVCLLVLLNTYYHWVPELRRPEAIALYSTPLIRNVTRGVVRLWPDIDRRLFTWQVGRFIRDPAVREELVPKLYEEYLSARPAFRRLNNDLLGTVVSRRRRVDDLRRFQPPVAVIFGALDPYLNRDVARRFAALFPHSSLHLVENAGHYVQIDMPERVADLMTAQLPR